MNTNSTAAELPAWQNAAVYEPASHNPDRLEAPAPIPATASESPAQESPSLARHRRKCAICNHPECEAIEDSYLNWISPFVIVREFELPSRSALYRHVEANGLPAIRRRRMHLALDRLIERADGAPVTGNTVIRAIMFSHQLMQQEQPSNRDTKLLESPITQTK